MLSLWKHCFQLQPPLSKQVKSALKYAASKLKNSGYVHGELRPQNILWDKENERIYIIDFDWAGLAGEAMYPK